MGNQPKPRRYDHVGAWFMTPQAYNQDQAVVHVASVHAKG